MSFEEEFYNKFPSYKMKYTELVRLKPEFGVYLNDVGGYFQIYADSFGNAEYDVLGIMEDIEDCCLDKQRVKEFLSSRVKDESGMVVFSYTEIKELGL